MVGLGMLLVRKRMEGKWRVVLEEMMRLMLEEVLEEL